MARLERSWKRAAGAYAPRLKKPAKKRSIRHRTDSQWRTSSPANFGKRDRLRRNEALVTTSKRKVLMLWTIFVILLILWLLGFIGFHVLGAYIHLLLVIAVVVLIIQLISGRRPL